MHVRSLLIGSSLAAILLGSSGANAQSAAPVAPSSTDGFVFVSVGGATFEESYQQSDFRNDYHGLTLEGGATGEFNLTSTLGFQGDVVLRSRNHDIPGPGGYGTSNFNTDVAGHVFYRDGNYLLGGIAQFGGNRQTYTDSPTAFSTYTTYTGLEAQTFLNDLTLYGQLAYERRTRDDQSDVYSGWIGNVEARYFLQPNFKVEAHLQYDSLDWSVGGGEADYAAGVGAEYRFDNLPISLFAKYDFIHSAFHIDGSSADSYRSANRVMVGLRFNFDGKTLEDRDRGGASLKPFLPIGEGSAGAGGLF